MNSSTQAIIIAVLVSLLVLTFAYLAYLVRILRRNRKNKSDDAAPTEAIKLDLEVDGHAKVEAKEMAEIVDLVSDDLNKAKEKVLDTPLETNANLSSLTDGSVASTRSQPSTSNGQELSEASNSNDGNSNTANTRSEDLSSSSFSSAVGKRPPQCSYKGKLQCTCQGTRKSADNHKQLHNPQYTSATNKNQSRTVSNGRYSTSGIERLQSSENGGVKVHQWISDTTLKTPKRPKSTLPYRDGEEDDDDTPIMANRKSLGKKVRSPVPSPRSRSRPSSPLSQVHRAASPGIVYPNAMWNNFHGWSSTPNLHSFASSASLSPPRLSSQQYWNQPPPRPNSSTLSSYKQTSSRQVRKSDDYYQQRIA